MEINKNNIDIKSKNNLDPKKEQIKKAIEDITQLIDKFENIEKIDENELINDIISYININNLNCLDIIDKSKETLLHSFCNQQKYFHLKIYVLTIEKILNNTNKLNEYLLKEDISKMNIFESASELGDIKIFSLLSKYLENNESLLSSLISQEKNNIFHISARENKILSLLFFYDYYKDINPNVLNLRNRSQWTPLIMACYKGYYEYVQILVNLGADYSIVEKNGKNALFYAIESQNYRIVKYLILIGIDKNKKDNKNKKPVEYSNDNTVHDLLDNKSLFQTMFKCQIQYKSLKGQKTHIYYLILLFFLFIVHILIIILFSSSEKEDECIETFDSINFSGELSMFIICILLESFGIFYYYFFHCKLNKNQVIINNENLQKKLYELYLENKNICVKCKKIKQINTQHCIACDKCIDNWDHHCFYLNACINYNNKKYFNIFMFQLFLIIIFNLILSVFLLMDIILYPKIYYELTNICAENQNNFDFISILLIFIFIIYFIASIYMLYGALMPFFIEFFCSSKNISNISMNFSPNENKVFLPINED